jgi:hypothetical protein
LLCIFYKTILYEHYLLQMKNSDSKATIGSIKTPNTTAVGLSALTYIVIDRLFSIMLHQLLLIHCTLSLQQLLFVLWNQFLN